MRRPAHRRFYSCTDSIERASAWLIRRHGSQAAALDAIRPALERMHQRMTAFAWSDAELRRNHRDSIRYGWRIEVRIELLRRERVRRQGVLS
jgi:hypothetical protein